MSTLYTTKVTAIGGRHGHIRSADGLLDTNLAMPRELGGGGGATNPETLFAGGYAACFENAILHVSRNEGLHIPDEDLEVTVEIGLSQNETGGFALSSALSVTIKGFAQEKAEALVAAADEICPYSNAIRGNVNVVFSVSAVEKI